MANSKKPAGSRKLVGWPLGLAVPEDVLHLTRLFLQVSNNYAKKGAATYKPYELSVSQVELLMTLAYAQRPMTLTELSPFLPIETASVSLVINRLYKRKLVNRRHSKTDRRNVFITLTPQGKKMVDTLWPPLQKVVMDMYTKSLTARERQLLIRMLRKIRDLGVPLPQEEPNARNNHISKDDTDWIPSFH